MVTCIVIPHDPASPPLLRELTNVGEFQEAVGGWLELIELPSLGVTAYVNEAARREFAPVNCRAMAFWWLHTDDPSQNAIVLGDVVLMSTGEHNGNVPDEVIHQIFDRQEFVIQARLHDEKVWLNTLARFDNVFDAGTWLMLFGTVMRHLGRFRIAYRTIAADSADEADQGSDTPW